MTKNQSQICINNRNTYNFNLNLKTLSYKRKLRNIDISPLFLSHINIDNNIGILSKIDDLKIDDDDDDCDSDYDYDINYAADFNENVNKNNSSSMLKSKRRISSTILSKLIDKTKI